LGSAKSGEKTIGWRADKTGDGARRDVFDHIEMFYSPRRKHERNGMPSSADVDALQSMGDEGIWNIWGYSI
jgi:hypothetical protein